MTRPRARDLGIKIGRLEPGKFNAITDVAGIRIGHTTLIEGSGKLVPGHGPIRTGVTAIIPHDGDTFLDKVTGTVHSINGFGEVTNADLVREMGFIVGPIIVVSIGGKDFDRHGQRETVCSAAFREVHDALAAGTEHPFQVMV